MSKKRKICLISPGHATSDPRLVKSADALHAAGYEVHVVAGWYYPPYDVLDRAIYEEAPWQRTVVYTLTGPRVLAAKLQQKLARVRVRRSRRPSLAAAMRAQHHAVRLLGNAAAEVKADLYIGHCLAGLAAAALAARRTGARYSFDAEDFHSAETEYAESDKALKSAIATIESELLPGCCYITAASPLIGEAYATTYKVDPPTPVLNVFPLSQAPTEVPTLLGDMKRAPKLYWFSQTIGPGRGLEKVVRALSRMKVRCDLELRGIPTADFPDELEGLAATSGFTGKIRFLPPAPPAEMARLASGYDLGLSVEQTAPKNRDLCLTNKIFTYLLAGVPVALSVTQAQSQLASELGNAAILLDLDDPDATAEELDLYFTSPLLRATARAEAWRLGQTRYNWDVEQAHLLRAVANVFTLGSRALSALRA